MAIRPYVNMSSLKLAISLATLTDYQLQGLRLGTSIINLV
jgi:hypothetical protein